MKLTFVGAAHEVTGSCHFLQAAGKNILIDCGMEQGPDLYENPGLPIPENEVDYVFLTHAHIDQRISAISCSATVRISRSSRRSGETEKGNVPAVRSMNRSM